MPLSPDQHLATYVPALSRVGGESGGPPRDAPHVESTFCTVLFADLSGFTSRTEQLSRLRNGPEQIGRLLNAHLGPLVDIIEAHGGDIVKFAGDAVLVCWGVDQARDGVRTTILAAARCALQMQLAIMRLEEDDPDRTMRLRVGLATGPVRVIHLGSQDARRVLLVTGDGVDRATKVGTIAEPGEVRIGRLAHQLVGEELLTDFDGEAPLVMEVQPFDPIEMPPPPARHWDTRFAAYLPRTVTHRVRGQTGTWLTETRVVTVMFVHLGKITIGSDPRRMNQVFETTHSHLEAHGGITNKLSVDEKGATLLAVFGLPPVVHEDDAARACRAALAVHGALKRLGEQPSIGLATGRAFCGEVGGQPRREYTVIGDTVNTSARLMQKAQGGIACEGPTARRAQRHVQFEALPAVRLKGKSEPVSLFRPIAVVDGAASAESDLLLFGREPLLDAISETMGTTACEGIGAAIVVSGGAGSGKSALRAAVIRSATEAGAAVLRTTGEALRRTRPGHPLRRLLSALYGTGQGARETQLVRDALIEAAGDRAASLPFVDDLLPVPLGSTQSQTTAPQHGARADLLARLVLSPLKNRRALIAVDDGQWLDPLTIRVLQRIRDSQSPVVVLVTTRPPPDACASTWAELHSLAVPRPIGALAMPQTRAMLAHNLGVRRVPTQMVQVVHERSGGNPLFILQLLDHLLATGAVVFQGDRVALEANRLASWQAQLPANLEGLLLSRVDHLAAESQFTLKVASVFGECFTTEGLVSVHPLVEEAGQLEADLRELREQEIIAPDDTAGLTDSWRFQHTLIRDAVYEIIPSAQRRQLHDAAAAHFQSLDPVSWFDVAEHYQSADNEDRAYDAYTRAASRAAQSGVPEDCAEVLEAVERLVPLFPPGPQQAANLAVASAIALRHSGELTAARDQLEHALTQLAREDVHLDDRRDALDTPTVVLLAARLDLDAGLSEQARHRAQLVGLDVTASDAQKGAAMAIEAHATWQTHGASAAQALHSEALDLEDWEAGAHRCLLRLAQAALPADRAAELDALSELIQSSTAEQVDPTARTRFGAAYIGALMLTGQAARGLDVVKQMGKRPSGPWCGPLEVLLTDLAPSDTCPLLHVDATADDRGRALHLTIRVAQAILASRTGDPEAAGSLLAEASAHWPADLHPTPELWPALLVGARLSMQLCRTAPQAVCRDHLDRTSALLARAAEAAPGVRQTFQWLRAELADARGQAIRAWWWRKGLAPAVRNRALIGVLGDSAALDRVA